MGFVHPWTVECSAVSISVIRNLFVTQCSIVIVVVCSLGSYSPSHLSFQFPPDVFKFSRRCCIYITVIKIFL